jgi:hypothetical protein
MPPKKKQRLPVLPDQKTKCFHLMVEMETRTVSDLTEWYLPPPRLQYYGVQTLEYRYINKLPMKKEWIWSNVQMSKIN